MVVRTNVEVLMEGQSSASRIVFVLCGSSLGFLGVAFLGRIWINARTGLWSTLHHNSVSTSEVMDINRSGTGTAVWADVDVVDL